MPEASVVICTYERPELNDTLRSLEKQTFKNFEVIIINTKGNLAELRQRGLEASCGRIVCFIDDDVVCTKGWLQGIIEGFSKTGVVGISGPTTVPESHRNNRDVFKFRKIKSLYDKVFLGPLAGKPGAISNCGCVSTASNFRLPFCYEGLCDFLEACNMSVNREVALAVGGFDKIYDKTSEWCEVDLGLKMARRGSLLFTYKAALYHQPSQSGVYSARLSTSHRWKNFMTFQKRWIEPSFKTYLYRGFIWLYLKIKQNKLV